MRCATRPEKGCGPEGFPPRRAANWKTHQGYPVPKLQQDLEQDNTQHKVVRKLMLNYKLSRELAEAVAEAWRLDGGWP